MGKCVIRPKKTKKKAKKTDKNTVYCNRKIFCLYPITLATGFLSSKIPEGKKNAPENRTPLCSPWKVFQRTTDPFLFSLYTTISHEENNTLRNSRTYSKKFLKAEEIEKREQGIFSSEVKLSYRGKKWRELWKTLMNRRNR